MGQGQGFYPSFPHFPSQYDFTNDPNNLFMCVLSILYSVNKYDLNRLSYRNLCISLCELLREGAVFKARSHNHKKRILGSSRLSVFLPVCPSVRRSSCVIAAPTERIPIKFDVGDIYDNLTNNSKIWLKSDKKYWVLYMKILLHFFVVVDINST